YLTISFLVEANQQRVTQPNRRRLEVARWPKQQPGQLVVRRGRLLHVDGDHLLAAADDDSLHRLRERKRLLAALLHLRGVGLLANVPFALLKEPLSLLAAGSALAMIHPVNRLSHETPPVLRGFTARARTPCSAKPSP